MQVYRKIQVYKQSLYVLNALISYYVSVKSFRHRVALAAHKNMKVVKIHYKCFTVSVGEWCAFLHLSSQFRV